MTEDRSFVLKLARMPLALTQVLVGGLSAEKRLINLNFAMLGISDAIAGRIR